MIDAENALIDLLQGLGYDARAELPPDLKTVVGDPFITVERTGGAHVLAGIDTPLMAVQFWAADYKAAKELAVEIDDQLSNFSGPSQTGIVHISRNSLYRFPHPLIRCGRYQGIYNLTTN